MIKASFFLLWLSLVNDASAFSCTQLFYRDTEAYFCKIRSYSDMNLTDFNESQVIDFKEYSEKEFFDEIHNNWLGLFFLSGGLILNASFELKENNFEQLLIEGAHGIDYNFSPNKQGRNSNLDHFYLNYGSMKTYSNSREIKNCSLNEIDRSKPGPLNGVTTNFGPYTSYELAWCPLILYQSYLFYLEIDGLTDSLVKRNLFSFQTVDEVNGSFSVEIVTFKTKMSYQLQITKELLSAQVLARSVGYYIWGTIKRIYPDALTQIDVHISLTVENPREFFCNNPDWLSMLNYSKPQEQRVIGIYQNEPYTKSLLNYDLYTSNKNAFYQYVNADFCLFAKYPVNQTKYFFHIGSFINLGCTCTIVWLLQNSQHLNTERPWDDFYQWDSDNFCHDIKEKINSCKFDYRLSLCKIQTIRPIHETRTGAFTIEIVHSVLMVKYALVVIMQPFFCLVIFVLNILTFLVIRRMRRLKLPKKSIYMYENIGFNSMCHVVLSVLFGLQPLIECIAAPNGIFCNSLFINDAPRLFYLLGQSFLGNAAKLCSNLTMIAFSLHRYLINKDKTNSRLLRLFQNMKPKKMFAAIIFSSLILSSVKLFVNERLNLINFFTKKDFLYILAKFEDDRENIFLTLLFLINQLFNDILAIFIILYIDYKCYQLQVTNSTKRNKILGQNKKMEEAIQNTNRMIIINGVLTAFLRAPELLADFYKFQHSLFAFNADLCYFTSGPTSSLCLNFFDISQFFYSLSGLLNFCLLFKFDGNFLASLRLLSN
nr:G protein-coupled receptor [Proales similis]